MHFDISPKCLHEHHTNPMTDELYTLKVLKLSVLLIIIVAHGSSIAITGSDVLVANVTGYQTPPEAFSSSPENHETSAVVNLAEAPVEVIGPRVVESGTPGKVERKRESKIGLETGSREFGFRDKKHACVIRDDDGIKEDSNEAKNGKTESDSMGVGRASAKRDFRSRVSDEGDDEEYDAEEPRNSRMIGDEDEDDDDDDDEADDVVVENEKKRRNLRRKAGRHNRQGPKIWDQWGKWTSCSVSCGAGKLTRWRHCVAGGCSLGEKEAQLKTCTYSAC